jgi:hypothetical protein
MTRRDASSNRVTEAPHLETLQLRPGTCRIETTSGPPEAGKDPPSRRASGWHRTGCRVNQRGGHPPRGRPRPRVGGPNDGPPTHLEKRGRGMGRALLAPSNILLCSRPTRAMPGAATLTIRGKRSVHVNGLSQNGHARDSVSTPNNSVNAKTCHEFGDCHGGDRNRDCPATCNRQRIFQVDSEMCYLCDLCHTPRAGAPTFGGLSAN